MRKQIRTWICGLAGLAMASLVTGCVTPLMAPTTRIETPPSPQKAMVTFVRPTAFGGAIQFGIWDGDKLVGILNTGSCIQYETTPGEHIFMARAENWSYLKATLLGGKKYYVVGGVFPGVWRARVALNPVDMRNPSSPKQVENWMNRLTPTQPVPEKANVYAEPRLPQVRKALQDFQNGHGKFVVLEADAGE